MSLRDRIAKFHDVFSRRRDSLSTSKPTKELSDATRMNIVMLYRDIANGVFPGGQQTAYFPPFPDFWLEIHSALRYKFSILVLSEYKSKLNRPLLSEENFEDTVAFLMECTTDHFLDFLELSFKIDHPLEYGQSSSQMIGAINEIFQVQGEPYKLTDFVKVEVEEEEPIPGFPASKQNFRAIKTLSYPQVMFTEDEVVHEESLAPALAVLGRPYFEAANGEFLDGLRHYRTGSYKECLSSCASSLESVLAMICEQQKWPHDESNTLGALLDIVVPKLGFESVFKESFKIVATLRNRSSSSHGGGTVPRTPDQKLARYAIGHTASIIVLLVDAMDETKRHP